MAELDIDKADKQIDALIERRAAERKAANREARLHAEAVRAYHLRGAAERRQEWAEYYYRLQVRAAEAMRERAAGRLAALIDGKA